MNKEEFMFLNRLATQYRRMPNDKNIHKEIFLTLCCKFQDSLQSKMYSPMVTKEELLIKLVDKKLIKMSVDKDTKEEKLPDDRIIRKCVRELQKSGYPIMSSSSVKGYFISMDLESVYKCEQENHKRALNILAVEKGYQKMQGFIRGQICDLDIVEEENKNGELKNV